MRVHVVLKATDLSSGEVKILADGPAILKADELLYRESGTGARHRIVFGDDLIIERKADVVSRTTIRERVSGTAVVESAYGTMELRTECLDKSRQDGLWRVVYAVYSGADKVLEQRLEWEIRPV